LAQQLSFPHEDKGNRFFPNLKNNLKKKSFTQARALATALWFLVFQRGPLDYGEFFVSLLEAYAYMHGIADFKGEHAVFSQVHG
jgi:hypothetical protein